MSTGTSSAGFDARFVGPPRRPFDWLRSLFDPPYEKVPLSPLADTGEVSCRFETTEAIHVVADGDAFEFQVFPTFVWRAAGCTREELEADAGLLMPRARRTARSFVGPLARRCPPHQARALEAEANEQLADKSWRVEYEDRSFTFGMTVRVVPDEQVRERLRPYWEERIKMECDHELGLRRAQLVDELTRNWSAILDKLEQDPRTMHAARLSEQQFAEVFGEFVTERKEVVRDLLLLLRSAVKGHGDLGLGPSEYTRAWDEALKVFQRQHGLTVPDEDSAAGPTASTTG